MDKVEAVARAICIADGRHPESDGGVLVWHEYKKEAQAAIEAMSIDLAKDIMREDSEVLEKLASPKWQPIDTAPKDGTEILVKGGTVESDLGGGDVYNIAHVFWDSEYGDQWELKHTCYYSVWIESPTHWMPLPQRPQENNNNTELLGEVE